MVVLYMNRLDSFHSRVQSFLDGPPPFEKV